MIATLSCYKRSKGCAAPSALVGWSLALFISASAYTVQSKTPAQQKPDWEDRIVPGSPLTVLDLTRRLIPDVNDVDGSDKITGADL